MNKQFPYPFVRLLLPLSAGILAGAGAATFYPILYIPAVLIWIYLLMTIIIPSRVFYYEEKYFQLFYYFFLVFILGFYLGSRQYEKAEQFIRSHQQREPAFYLLKVNNHPVIQDKTVKVIARIYDIPEKLDLEISEYCGKGIFYFERDSISEQIAYSEYLVARIRLMPVQKAGNPNEFDYRGYLLRQGIACRVYVPKSKWWFAGVDHQNIFHCNLNKFRTHILGLYAQSIPNKEVLGVTSAMLLGHDELLDRQTQKAFSDAGVMHILCVSGLHVGIIYMILNFMLVFLNRIRYGQLLKTICILILIWFYAGIAGMQAPVVRASLMFSLVAAAKMLQRQAYVYNTLAAAAFIILLFDPLALYRVGFQLSFAAVFFIVWLYKPLNSALPVHSKLISRCWSIASVSVVATLGTLPLVLHYFHQFPLYFIFSNLLVIPLSFMLVAAGVLVMLFSFCDPVINILIAFIEVLVGVLKRIVEAMQSLPYARIEGLYIDTIQTLILFMLIILIAAIVVQKQFAMLKYALLALLLLLTTIYLDNWHQEQKSQLIIYNLKEGTAIDVVTGKDHYFIADSNVLTNKDLIEYRIRGNWTRSRLNPPICICLGQAGLKMNSDLLYLNKHVLVFGNFKILFLDEYINPELIKGIYFDALILNSGFTMDTALFNKIRYGTMVIGSDVPDYRKAALLKNESINPANLYDLKKMGAFVKDIH